MQSTRAAALFDSPHCVEQGCLLEEVAILDALVDAREILIDHAAGAHRGMAHLGVAHLSRGQSDGFARGRQRRMWKAIQQLGIGGRARQLDGVVILFVPQAPAVEHDKDERTAGHGAHYRPTSWRTAERPAYVAALPSASSIRSSWLYLATRSVRLADPVLIWPALVATARSAMVTSSV